MDSVVMATAIHIEIDTLCLLMLCVIAFQSLRNVSQQMSRVLFRNLVFGIMLALALDIAWMLIDGHVFPGGIFLNRLVNALYLSLGVVLGCVWYLYVLETLGYTITRRLSTVVMLPGAVFLALNLISMKTEWVFFVTPENVYVRGPLFWLQTVGAYGMLLLALGHILMRLINRNARVPRRVVLKLLGFYIIPVCGALITLPFTGMPGVWTCAAISIALMYMDDQDREILRDSLTGLNNRKTLSATFADYTRQLPRDQALYLFMMDLDDFKHINDTFGHPAGDQALVATAKLLSQSMSGVRGIIARFGGDEFLIMGFWADDAAAEDFRRQIIDRFAAFNREGQLPFRLSLSIGYARYQPGQDFDSFLGAADARLYAEKARRKQGRARR